jgi:hypothetical protein
MCAYSQLSWEAWNKCCYHLLTRLMTLTDLIQVVPTRTIYNFCDKTSQLVNNLLYLYLISDLLEQRFELHGSLLVSSTLLQDDKNLFQTCHQLGTSSAKTYWWQAVSFTRVTLNHTHVTWENSIEYFTDCDSCINKASILFYPRSRGGCFKKEKISQQPNMEVKNI